MITATWGDRKVYAMTLNEPVNDVCGIVQCALVGCEAHYVIMREAEGPAALIAWFAQEHDCRSVAARAGSRGRRGRRGGGGVMNGPVG